MKLEHSLEQTAFRAEVRAWFAANEKRDEKF